MSPPWMPLYVADYRKDTSHLSAAEHGAYLLLIMHYWATGGLPDEDRQLARIACMTVKEWARARPVIIAFFEPGWRHKRVDAELARVGKVSEAYATRARKAAEKRWSKDASSNASSIAEAPEPQSQSQSDTSEPSVPRTGARKVRSKSDMHADWVPDDRTWEACLALLGGDRRRAGMELDKFRDWAVNQPPRKDWAASLRNWFRRAAEDRHATGPPRQGAANSERAELARIASRGLFEHDEPPRQTPGTIEIIPPDTAERGASDAGRSAAFSGRAHRDWPPRDSR